MAASICLPSTSFPNLVKSRRRSTIFSSSPACLAIRSPCCGARGRILLQDGRFSGLKMSSAEGLAKRVRDPQIVADNESSETMKKTRSYVRATVSQPGVRSLVVAVSIPLIAGIVDGLVNSPGSPWYFDLKKPKWQPPSFLFGGTWSLLYPLMGLASWLVWAEGGWQQQSKALTLYVVQLVLNLLWPVLFFGKHNLGLAFVDIVALSIAVAATIAAFQPVNHVAANLMKPYLAWVIFATALNGNLWLLNRGGSTAAAEHAHEQ